MDPWINQLKLLKHFKKFTNLELVEMPGALLGDCRNEGLRRTRFNWHLRWDECDSTYRRAQFIHEPKK